MNHRCPHHPERVLVPLREPQGTQGCWDCEGIWLPGDVVVGLLGQRPPARALRALPVSTLSCPEDSTALHAIHHEGVEVDVCARCTGVWLDRGELETILANRGGGDDHVELDEDASEIIEDWFDSARPRSGKRTESRVDETPNVSNPSSASSDAPVRVAGTRTEIGPSSTWQLERADPLPTRASASPAPMLESAAQVEPLPAVDDGGVLDSLGDAVGSVFDFIGDAFSGL